MNKVILMGRLVKDPTGNQSGNVVMARYTLAVDRPTKDKTADFISCIGFGKTAEFITKYLKKGTQILVEGRIQTGSYKNKEGQTIYTTDVVVEKHEFCGSKSDNQQTQQQTQPQVAQGTQNVMDGFEETDGLSFLN